MTSENNNKNKPKGNPWKLHELWLCEICKDKKFLTKEECDKHEKICNKLNIK